MAKTFKFFWNMHTLLYTRKYENSIFALQLNWLQHRQSCSHEREGTKRKNKIKRNSIYILNEIYLHMSSNLHCNLGNGQNEFLWLYSNKSWNSSYDFFVAFLLCIGIIKSSSFLCSGIGFVPQIMSSFSRYIWPVDLLYWLFLQKDLVVPILSYISFFIDIKSSYFPNAKYFLVKRNAKGLGHNFLARIKIA